MTNKKGWANPAPAGLISLAVIAFMFFALLSGKVNSAGSLIILGCWLIGGFLIQFTVAIIEYMEGALLGSNVFLLFSGFFMLTGAMECFVKYFAMVNQWTIDTTIAGWGWLAMFIMLLFATFAYLKQASMVMGLIVSSVTVAVGAVAFMDLGWMTPIYNKPIAAYGLLIAGIFALYQASAIFLNDAFGRRIFPVGNPILMNEESKNNIA